MKPDESFGEHVRDVLAHLHDYPYLQTHPVIDQFEPGANLDAQARVRFLRSLVLEAIEELNPGADVPLRSHRARRYNVLDLHYIEGLMIQEVARELAISERQVYRDLRRAEWDLAVLLWPRRRVPETPPDKAASPPADATLTEAQRFRGQVEELEIRPLVEGAIRSVDLLAEDRNVRISLTVPTRRHTIRANRMMARQALVSVLSHAIRHANPDRDVTLSVAAQRGGVQCMVSYLGSTESREDRDRSLVLAQQLVDLLGGEWETSMVPDKRRLISFSLGVDPRTLLLVVDDNEGLVELFRRYLTGEDYRVIGASDGVEGLRMAEQHSPDIIVLDVMMPQQDGWEVLQLLRNRKATQQIPVLLCSVVEDPELAFSLGAAEFLVKPVKREELLKALELCRQR